MEGQIKVSARAAALWLAVGLLIVPAARAQETAGVAGETGDITLRKNVQSREFNGQEFEGEDRVIVPGDSMWQILVKEKGVPEARFGQVLIVVRGLNPQIRSLDVLRVGDKIFIPANREYARAPASSPPKKEEARPTGRGTTRDYRVKAGDHLYQILREQFAGRDDREWAQYYLLVKDLNPQRKNWDVLLEGEVIRLPERLEPRQVTIAGKAETGPSTQMPEAMPVDRKVSQPTGVAASKVIGWDYPKQLRTRENMELLAQVVQALGGEMQTTGEEILALKDDTIRLDRAAYPVINNPKLQQKVLLDTGDRIPASLRSRLSDGSGMSVVSIGAGSSLQDSVGQILARLGYQPIPSDRPVVIQSGSATFEVKGHWVALGPEQNDKAQEILVVNLRENQQGVPDYIKAELALKGLQLKDIPVLPGSGMLKPSETPTQTSKENIPPISYWPRDKREFIDAALLSLRVSFGVSETIKTQLRDGLTVEVRSDRNFEKDGKRTALFFNRIDPAFKTALQDREKVRVIEIDVAALDHKEIAAQLLTELGDPSKYQEHRFPVGENQEQLQVKAWGFLLAQRGMFLTDRDIPPVLYRFFFEKGLEIVYF
jgi:hypothetical protein